MQQPECSTPEDAGWTPGNADAAWAEGWAIFDCDGSLNGPWQIQQIDEPDECNGLPEPYPFKEDTDVWELLVREETELHLHALDVIRKLNPIEYDAIVRWVAVKRSIQSA